MELLGFDANHWQTLWACETMPAKQRWIAAYMHDGKDVCVFTDISELHKTPYCAVHKRLGCEVSLGHIAIAGFSCKSLSKMNVAYQKGSHDSALRSGTGSSGETFFGLLWMLDRFQPPVYIGENVEDLMQVGSDNRAALLEASHPKRSSKLPRLA